MRDKTPAHVVTGKIVKPHGVRGWVKIEVLTANPSRFSPGNSFIIEGEECGERLVLKETRRVSGELIARFRGVEDRERADCLRGRALMVRADELGEAPMGTLWEHQVIGLEVRTRRGEILGEVAEIMVTGANDVLVIRGKREYLIPVINEVVVEVDTEAGLITVEPLPGLLED
ncbi:MAG: ribosome maturation factor RimM [Actinomycetota bacterium]|nr:ribosome maturation factor RimM [Actinomycetota bacterium]